MALPAIFVEIGAKTEAFQRAMGDVSKRLNAIDRDAAKAFSGFEKIGERLTTLGTGLTAAISLPLAGAGIAATKFATDFDSEMRKVTSLISGVTQKDFENLSKQTLQLSRDLGVDAVNATKGLYEAISAGVPKENAISFLADASKSAIAGATQTGVAVDVLTTFMAAYGDKAKDTKKLSDALFQAVNVGKFQFEDLAKSIGPAAQQASNLGVSYEELLAATSTLSLSSGGVSQAVTQIESAMRALLAPTKEMQAAFTKIGVESGTAAIQAFGFEGTLQKLRETTGGSAEAFNALFGRIEGATGALGLTGDNAKKAAADYAVLKSASEGVGATQKALEERNKSTARQFEILSASLKTTAIELGVALLPAVNGLLQASKPLVDLLSQMVKGFAALPGPLQAVVLGLAGIAAAAGPVVLVAGQMLTAYASLQAALIAVNGAAALSATTALPGLATAMGAATLASQGLALAMNAIPFVALAAGIAYALDKLSQTKTAQENLARAGKEQGETLDYLNKKYREQQVALGNVAASSTSAKDKLLDFVQTMKSATGGGSVAKAFDADRAAIDKFKKEIQDSEVKTKLYNKALAELGLGVKNTGAKHQEAREKVAAFLDKVPILAEKVRIVSQEYQKNIHDLAEMQLAQERGKKAVAEFGDGLEDLNRALAEVGKTTRQMPSIPKSILGDTGTESIRQAVKAIDTDLKTLGINHDKTADKLKEAYERIKAAGIATPYEILRAERAVLEATIKEHQSAGEQISATDLARLEALKKATGEAGGEQVKATKKWAQQVSTIINDLAKDVARATVNLFKGFFDSDGFNKKLKEDSDKLRSELAERASALDEFRNSNASKIAGVEAQYAAQLAKETGDLLDELDTRKKEYAGYVEEVATKLTELAGAESARLDAEISDLAGKLRDKEAAYEDYVGEVAAKEEEIRSSHAERLAEQLSDLRNNLRDRTQAYEDFATDANTNLARIGADLAETISDATTSSNRKTEDENRDFARDTAKLNADLRKAQAKGDKVATADIKRQLAQRTEDHELSIKRIQEDLAEQIDDARKRAEEQTADLKTQFARRTRDHQEYIAENVADQEKVTIAHAEEQAKQLADLQSSLDKRTAELVAFRESTLAAIDSARLASAARYAKEEADLQGSLEQRRKALEAFETQTAAKIDELTEHYKKKQAEEVAALNLEFGNKLKEYDTYRAGVETKLGELEDAHKGPLDRIKDMFTSVFAAAEEAILRVASEAVIGKLVKEITGLVTDLFPSLGKAIRDIFGIGVGAAGSAAGGAASTAAGAAGAAGQAAGAAGQIGGAASGAAGSAVSGALGTVSAVSGIVTGIATAVSSIIGNFQFAAMNKTLDLIEKEVRGTQIGINGPKGVIELQHEAYKRFRDIDEFMDQKMGPSLNTLIAWTEANPIAERIQSVYDLIANKTNTYLDRIAGGGMTMAASGGMSFTFNAPIYLDSRLIGNAIAEKNELAGGGL